MSLAFGAARSEAVELQLDAADVPVGIAAAEAAVCEQASAVSHLRQAAMERGNPMTDTFLRDADTALDHMQQALTDWAEGDSGLRAWQESMPGRVASAVGNAALWLHCKFER